VCEFDVNDMEKFVCECGFRMYKLLMKVVMVKVVMLVFEVVVGKFDGGDMLVLMYLGYGG